MRRSLAQKGQDICIFCALRLGIESSPTTTRPFTNVRSYHTKTALRQPGAAQAAQREEEDEPNVPIRYLGLQSRDTPPRTDPYPRQPNQLPRQDYSRASQSFPRTVSSTTPGTKYKSVGSDSLLSNAAAPAPRNPRGSMVMSGFDAFEQATRDERSSSQMRKARKAPEAFQQPFQNTQSRPPRDYSEPFRQPPRTWQARQQPGFSEPYQDRSRASRDSRPPFQQEFRTPFGRSREQPGPQPAAPHDLDLETPEGDREDVSGNRRRGNQKFEKPGERRSRRYETGEDDDPTTRVRKKFVPSRKTAAEQEMEEIEEQLEGKTSSRKRKKKAQRAQPVQLLRPRVDIPEYISVQHLAQVLDVKVNAFIEKLEEEGFEGAQQDHVLDGPNAAMLAELYGFEPVMSEEARDADLVPRAPAEDKSSLPPRPPVVTIMGHVDHGKTTILDWLRKSSVVETEHGGITQHIGAFSVTMPVTGRKITFLDTPGHAAFLDMRRRGAVVTDIVVLVVAADDSVKPQTIEAIKHATEAKVQIIVAINKIDKGDANVEKVRQDLARYDIHVEEYGGETQAVPLSGKTGQGMDALEEAIITLADVSDFRAETDGPAEGWVIESKVTAGGRVATVLVRRGTLRVGDCIVAGNTWARVRTLRNDAGQLVSEAPPGTPVQVDGWRGEDPTAGLEVLQADDEQHAKEVVELRIEKAESVRAATDMVAINKSKSEEAEAYAKVRAWRTEHGWVGKRQRWRKRDNTGWIEAAAGEGPKRVPFVVKADVAGSAEAITAAVSAIGNNEVVADVIHSGTGQLSESDIKLLATTGETCYAISFNQPVDATMYRLAEAADLRILDHNIIYKVTDDVKARLSEELPPLITYKVLGEAEVGKIFEINVKRKKLKVAGCRVTNGTISKAQKVRVLRDKEVIYTGTLDSLKNVKKDVGEMRKGGECGMSFDHWEDFEEGDQIQNFEEIKEKRTLY